MSGHVGALASSDVTPVSPPRGSAREADRSGDAGRAGAADRAGDANRACRAGCACSPGIGWPGRVGSQSAPAGHTAAERGSATVLAAGASLVAAVVVAAGAVAILGQVSVHRVQGAADLVALTAAQAHNVGTSAGCAAAARAAEADRVVLVSCDVRDDGWRFAVTVTVRGHASTVWGLPLGAEATARAGVR